MSADHSPDPEQDPGTPEATEKSGATDSETAPAGTRRRNLLAAAFAVLAVALVALGVLALIRADSLRTDAPMDNRALIDSRSSAKLTSQVSTALSEVLSYDYRKPTVARKAAERWLAGDAPRQYRILFGQLTKAARGQDLVLRAKVVSLAVTTLRGKSAQLLVFVDQQSTRASDGQSSVSAAQVQIAAKATSGRWRITELQPI